MPTGSVPQNEQHSFTQVAGYSQQPFEHQNGVIGIGLSLTQIEVSLSSLLANRAKTSNGFILLVASRLSLDQTRLVASYGPLV